MITTTTTGVRICPSCGADDYADSRTCSKCDDDFLLQDRYLLNRVLGSNVGTTYLAYDTFQKKSAVVVKELHVSRLDSWKTEELFQREVAVLRRLNHPCIPRYLDHFIVGQGKRQTYYLVQQYLDGETIQEELAHRTYSEEDIFDLLEEVLSILQYLQNINPPLIHRDIKPSNLMRLANGSIALIDFGAVRDFIAPQGDSPTVAGTFGFMAPEQFQGKGTMQTDLYALGAVAVYLLSRIPPEQMLDGTKLSWQKHVNISSVMKKLLTRLLAVDPCDRPKSAKTAIVLLQTTRYNLHKEPTTIPEKTPSRNQSLRNMILLGSAAGFVLLIAFVIGFMVLVTTGDDSGIAEKGTLVESKPAIPEKPIEKPVEPPAESQPANQELKEKPVEKSPSIPAYAEELTEQQMIELLVSHSWKGSLQGELQFTRQDGQLKAQLIQKDTKFPFQSAELGAMSTMVLVWDFGSGDVERSSTFYGALSADHKTISGSFETVHRKGNNEYDERGNWYVKAQQ